MLLIALLALLLLVAVYCHVSQKRMRDAVANIRGPYCLPVLGAIYKIFEVNPNNVLQLIEVYRKKYGNIMRIWIMHRLVVMVIDAELNEQILASPQHITKHPNYRILHQWLGVGLLLSDGKKWSARRKIIAPTFHLKILQEFVGVFDEQSNTLVKCLAKKADGQTAFDVYPFVCLAALDIIAETVMGTKVHAQVDASSSYAAAVNEMTKLMAWRFMQPHLNSEFIFSIMYPHLKLRQMKLIKIMHEFTIKVIENRRETLKTSLAQATTDQIPKDDDDEFEITRRSMALLDVLLQSSIDGKPLSNEDIREEVDTFMFEGHDTTTSALSFALHLIARHPAVQMKLLTEINNMTYVEPNRRLTLRDLNDLKYTECVIKETLRLYPSVPFIGRELEKDLKYTHSKIGDGIIPAGTEVLIFIEGMMRNKERFKNPDDFIPERHENNIANAAFSMMPFSAGPRNCIGQRFAMLEMKTVLVKVLQAYELLPLGAKVQQEVNIVMRSSNGFHLGLRKRSV